VEIYKKEAFEMATELISIPSRQDTGSADILINHYCKKFNTDVEAESLKLFQQSYGSLHQGQIQTLKNHLINQRAEEVNQKQYWLKLFNHGVLYGTSGHPSYLEANKYKMLWMSVNRQQRDYAILHKEEGIWVEEGQHYTKLTCAIGGGCGYKSKWSSYVTDQNSLQEEMRKHRSLHDHPVSETLFKRFAIGFALFWALVFFCAWVRSL
jgi:hypothetical protein